MSSPDTPDKGRREAVSSRSPTLIMACSPRGRAVAMVAACREFEKRQAYNAKERQ